jgi:hypothetical protein
MLIAGGDWRLKTVARHLPYATLRERQSQALAALSCQSNGFCSVVEADTPSPLKSGAVLQVEPLC